MRLERVTGEPEIQSTSFIEPLNTGALEGWKIKYRQLQSAI